MSFFSRLITPARKARKRFDKARRAEIVGQFFEARDQFEIVAASYDEHFAQLREKGESARTSDLVKAGMAYTRLGRNDDALAVLDECIRRKEIPDAYLHAGYAAARLGYHDRAVGYWTDYPKWAEQREIHVALREQLAQLRRPSPDLNTACSAIIEAFYRQDRDNKVKDGTRSNEDPLKRGY